MVKIYVNSCGWILGRDKKGKLRYTKFKEEEKPNQNEYDKEFESYARQAEQEGHHIDKVRI